MLPSAECPRFMRCNVNRCPLDPAYVTLPNIPGDTDRYCPMERGVRNRIGVKYSDVLTLKGLTRQENVGLTRMANLTPEQRSQIAARLANARK